jgi:hypothetical protein
MGRFGGVRFGIRDPDDGNGDCRPDESLTIQIEKCAVPSHPDSSACAMYSGVRRRNDKRFYQRIHARRLHASSGRKADRGRPHLVAPAR